MSAREAALVTVAALLPYLTTATFGPTYDDHHHIVDNVFVQDPSNVRFLFSPAYFTFEVPDQGRPVLLATHLLDAAIDAGFGARHLQSGLWHALACLLLLALMGSLGFDRMAAAAGACLFAVHPACVEAVAGVSNREDLLATVFVLATLLASHRYLTQGALGWLLAAGGALALGLLSKESALAAPLLLLTIAACVPAWRAASRRRAFALALVMGLALGAFALIQLRLGVPSLRIGAGGEALRPATLGAWMSLAPTDTVTLGWIHAAPVIAYRTLRVLIGWPLSAEHDPRILASSGAVIAGLWVTLALVGIAALAWRRDRRGTLAVAWLVLAGAPTLATPWLLNPIADRYLYLPATLAVATIGALLFRAQRAGPIVLGLALTFAIARTGERVQIWQDDVTLFSDAVTHAPGSARAWLDLGAAQMQRERLDDAEVAFLRAAELAPRRIAPPLNLGLLALARGDRRAALPWLARAVSAQPTRAERPLASRALSLYVHTLRASGRDLEAREVVRDHTRGR